MRVPISDMPCMCGHVRGCTGMWGQVLELDDTAELLEAVAAFTPHLPALGVNSCSRASTASARVAAEIVGVASLTIEVSALCRIW